MTIKAINNLSQNWQIGNIKEIKRFKSGVINQSYYIKTDQGEYVLKKYRDKMKKEIAFEISLLSCLKDLLVPEVVSANGKQIIKLDSSQAIIYRYIQGYSLEKLRQRQRRQVGQFLAKFHRQTRNFKWTDKRNELYNFSKQKINLFSHAVAASKIPYQRRFQTIKGDISEYRLNLKLPRGVIHVDVKPENVLFYKGKLRGVIDCDNSYIGPRLLDLAKTMVWFGIDKKRFNLEHAKDIFDGYMNIRKLANLECSELYKAIKFAFASHLFVDFYMMSVKKITKQYFKFLMNNFYSSYKSFNLSKEDFYKFL